MADRGEPDETEIVTTYTGGAKWLPIFGQAERKITQRWTRRVEEFSDHTRELTGLTADEIGERVERREELGDLIGTAGRKAGDTADAEFRRVLAHLVAAGILDDAKIDEIGYLTTFVVQMEPFDMRVLHAFGCEERFIIENNIPERDIPVVDVQTRTGAPLGLTVLSTDRLYGLGLVTLRVNVVRVVNGHDESPGDASRLTPIGQRVLELSGLSMS